MNSNEISLVGLKHVSAFTHGRKGYQVERFHLSDNFLVGENDAAELLKGASSNRGCLHMNPGSRPDLEQSRILDSKIDDSWFYAVLQCCLLVEHS